MRFINVSLYNYTYLFSIYLRPKYCILGILDEVREINLRDLLLLPIDSIIKSFSENDRLRKMSILIIEFIMRR